MHSILPDRPLPSWLAHLTEESMYRDPFPLEEILQNSLYYPGRRLRWRSRKKTHWQVSQLCLRGLRLHKRATHRSIEPNWIPQLQDSRQTRGHQGGANPTGLESPAPAAQRAKKTPEWVDQISILLLDRAATRRTGSRHPPHGPLQPALPLRRRGRCLPGSLHLQPKVPRLHCRHPARHRFRRQLDGLHRSGKSFLPSHPCQSCRPPGIPSPRRKRSLTFLRKTLLARLQHPTQIPPQSRLWACGVVGH